MSKKIGSSRPKGSTQPPTINKALSIDWVLSGKFVELPPDGAVNADLAKGTPSPTATRIHLKASELGFAQTKNPIYAIQAFLIANGSGLFPPLWALDWVNEGFQRYYDGQGLVSLDKALGIAKGRGENSPFKALIEQERDDQLARDIFRLTTLFPISANEAATMVAERIKNTPNWNKTAYKSLKALSPATLEDKYSRELKASWDTPLNRKILKEGWSPSRAQEFLNSFPKSAWPINLSLRLSKAPKRQGRKCLRCNKALSSTENRLCRQCFRINSTEPD